MSHLKLSRFGLGNDYRHIGNSEEKTKKPPLGSQSPDDKVASPEQRSKDLCEKLSRKGSPQEKIGPMKELIHLLSVLPGEESSAIKKVTKAAGNVLQDPLTQTTSTERSSGPMASPRNGAPTVIPATQIAFFATEHKRAFDAILTQLTPVKQLASIQTVLLAASRNLPRDQRQMPHKVLRSIEHREAMAPLWGELFQQLKQVKPERQQQAIKTFNNFLTEATSDKERKALAVACGNGFAELAKACDDLSISAKADVYELFQKHYQNMSSAQEKEVAPILKKHFPELAELKEKR